MTDDHNGHKELYFQIRENEKATSELRTQVAVLVVTSQHIAESSQIVANAMADHVTTHKENASTWKTSAISFGFNMLSLCIAGGVGAAIAKLAGS